MKLKTQTGFIPEKGKAIMNNQKNNNVEVKVPENLTNNFNNYPGAEPGGKESENMDSNKNNNVEVKVPENLTNNFNNLPGAEPGGKENVNMTLSPNKSFEVKEINSSLVEDIKKAINEILSDKNNEKIIYLMMNSSSGSVSEAISLLNYLSVSEVEIITQSNGELDLAATILVAGSKFGKRKSKEMTMFRLFENNKSIGKVRKTLTPNEKNSLDILSKLSGGKKSRIKSLMLKGLKATANEAKSLGLIDEVEGFKDKYEKERNEAKKKAYDNSEKEVG